MLYNQQCQHVPMTSRITIEIFTSIWLVLKPGSFNAKVILLPPDLRSDYHGVASSLVFINSDINKQSCARSRMHGVSSSQILCVTATYDFLRFSSN